MQLSCDHHQGVPGVLPISKPSTAVAMDIMRKLDISSNAKKVKHSSCEQLAYNR